MGGDQRQTLEFCTDLCCVEFDASRKGDKPVSKLKKQVFMRLADLYRALGSRMRRLKIKDGNISWAACGHFQVETKTSAGVAKIL
eukprot:5066885-Amphidinium_carterae.1